MQQLVCPVFNVMCCCNIVNKFLCVKSKTGGIGGMWEFLWGVESPHHIPILVRVCGLSVVGAQRAQRGVQVVEMIEEAVAWVLGVGV